MNGRTAHFIWLTAAVFLAACASAPAPPVRPEPVRPETVAEVKAAMERYNQYVLAMDAESIAASFTDDGEVIDRGRSIARGREAIRKFLASFKGVVRLDENATTIQSVNVQGDTALVTGTYRQRATLLARQRTIEVQGRLEAEWVRQPTGEWLIRRMRTKPPL